MNTTKIGAELVVEATASLKQEVEKELKVPDPAQGTIADLRVFNRALTAHEIKGLYGQGNTP